MAFVQATTVTARRTSALPSVCSVRANVPRMGWDMDGSGLGNLSPLHIKSSAVEMDRRSFKVTYVLPSESRGYSGRELQNIYTTKIVPFSSWYAEQQRIQKMGGTIYSVELAVGSKMRSCGNT